MNITLGKTVRTLTQRFGADKDFFQIKFQPLSVPNLWVRTAREHARLMPCKERSAGVISAGPNLTALQHSGSVRASLRSLAANFVFQIQGLFSWVDSFSHWTSRQGWCGPGMGLFSRGG